MLFLPRKVIPKNMLKGKTSLITGASLGIGKGIAETFTKNGANIAFTFASSVEKARAFDQKLSDKYGLKAKGFKLCSNGSN